MNKSPMLNLGSVDLAIVPPDLRKLTFLEKVNLSDNFLIRSLADGCFPRHIREIVLTGCSLEVLPTSLSQLHELRRLDVGANRISKIEVIFSCPALQHAGFPYNQISALPEACTIPAGCGLYSLDLGHNQILRYDAVLPLLKGLPKLSNLLLAGNPIALLPDYDPVCRSCCPSLKFFDSIKIDILGGGSRPATAISHPSLASSRQASLSGFDVMGGPTSILRIQLESLQPTEDPYRALEGRTSSILPPSTDAGGTFLPIVEAPSSSSLQPPLQPVDFHVEFTDLHGTAYASVPLRVLPPRPATGETKPDPKQKVTAAKAAAKVGKGGKGEGAPPSPPLKLKRGALEIELPVRASLEWRDWLRRGIDLKLVCTKHEAVLKQESDQEAPAPSPPPAAAAAAKAKGKGKGEAEAPPPPPSFEVVTTQFVAGTATVLSSLLVSGHTLAQTSIAEFVPIPGLWDESGIRMGLHDDRHPKGPVATMACTLTLIHTS